MGWVAPERMWLQQVEEEMYVANHEVDLRTPTHLRNLLQIRCGAGELGRFWLLWLAFPIARS